MPKYKVRDGYAFKVDEDTTVDGGAVVELEDEDLHLTDHRLEPVEGKPSKPSKDPAA